MEGKDTLGSRKRGPGENPEHTPSPPRVEVSWNLAGLDRRRGGDWGRPGAPASPRFQDANSLRVHTEGRAQTAPEDGPGFSRRREWGVRGRERGLGRHTGPRAQEDPHLVQCSAASTSFLFSGQTTPTFILHEALRAPRGRPWTKATSRGPPSAWRFPGAAVGSVGSPGGRDFTLPKKRACKVVKLIYPWLWSPV